MQKNELFRRAVMQDLPQVKAVYENIVRHMLHRGLSIWDEWYPCMVFEEDIRRRRLYLLLDENGIAAAFALSDTNAGADAVGWRHTGRKALYLERLGVCVGRLGQGLGSRMLGKAKETARLSGAGTLRLFVAESNAPAIRLYEKNGFTKAAGVYEEAIDGGAVLRETGWETAL